MYVYHELLQHDINCILQRNAWERQNYIKRQHLQSIEINEINLLNECFGGLHHVLRLT